MALGRVWDPYLGESTAVRSFLNQLQQYRFVQKLSTPSYLIWFTFIICNQIENSKKNWTYYWIQWSFKITNPIEYKEMNDIFKLGPQNWGVWEVKEDNKNNEEMSDKKDMKETVKN